IGPACARLLQVRSHLLPSQVSRMTDASRDAILVRGARQNNLKNLDLDLPLNALIVVTGVSGSGKSSLVFDTLYAEGQRRYVETFSPYARQFLDRMDKPQVESISGIPPAIAIDQTNPVRTSRSTVGTMTELNDHLKLLFARAAALFCQRCARPVQRDTADGIYADVLARAREAGDPRLLVSFPVVVPGNFTVEEVRELLTRQGYTRFLQGAGAPAPPAPPDAPAGGAGKSARGGRKRTRGGRGSGLEALEVVQDRMRIGGAERGRVLESLEAALRVGRGRVNVHRVDEGDPPAILETWRYSSELRCAHCDLSYRTPVPSQFSFNSPLGACESCRGFGRTIGIDYGLVIPDDTRSLRGGAVKPWQTKSYEECQEDLERFAKLRGVALDTPWRELPAEARRWVIEGEGPWTKKVWYGVQRFFAWLETRAYKMHVRVLLSRYRAYTPCSACDGARLKSEALLWRIGSGELAGQALGGSPRFRPRGVDSSPETLAALPGLSIHDLMLLPVERSHEFFRKLTLPRPLDEATALLLAELRTRLGYLVDVGLGYLTLDRQSRTLSGGELERVDLTTAIGSSLVNTLYILDEPSIGWNACDSSRLVGILKKLRDNGNTVVVVRDDGEVIRSSDHVIDLGPGAGEHGGRVQFAGPTAKLLACRDSLTADYLSGRRSIPVPPRRRRGEHGSLRVRAARANNLQSIDCEIPLRTLTCITGVSGSGKSTLVEEVIYRGLRRLLGEPAGIAGEHDAIEGWQSLGRVVLVDQAPIGTTPRANLLTYMGAYDGVRRLFAASEIARLGGYTASTFSFNVEGGRCEACRGEGYEKVEMQFLSDVYVPCPECEGGRFRS